MQGFFYHEPRLLLSQPGEFIVRLFSVTAYFVLAAGAILFLFLSDLSRPRYAAALVILFLIDRLMHVKEAEKTLLELKEGTANLADAVTPAAYHALNYAFRKALALREPLAPVLLERLLGRHDVLEPLRRLGVTPEAFREKLKAGAGESAGDRDTYLKEIEILAVRACDVARATGERYLEPRSIFGALAASSDPTLAQAFALFNLSPADIGQAIIFGRWKRRFARLRRLPASLGGFAHRPRFLRHRVMNRAWTARPTPTLDQYATDLTDLARAEEIGLLIGHEREFARLVEIIARPGKPNAVLVGGPGVGKSSIIAHLAFKMVKDEVPPVLFDKRLVSLELEGLLANAAPEELAGRLKAIAEEVSLAGNIVLFIPNAHDLFRTGRAKELSAVDFLLPLVKNGVIPVIAETYPKAFKQFIEPRSDFLEQFEVVEVAEISEDDAVRFLIYASLLLEAEFKVTVTFRAVKRSVELAHRYFRNRMLPGSAIDLLKQALARAKESGQRTLDEGIVVAVAESESKVPIERAGGAEAEKLLNLEKLIHERLVDQDTAVKAVSRALREYRSGLARRGGPIATFLFVGPTGVGKTELAKILTQVQFGSKDLMHRFDMSEYQDRQSIFRFIGTPDGERTGTLTDAMLEEPYSLILLDEFEKAHPDILNLFLQVFDDGRLTDSLGRTVSFEHSIIIATSNAHSDFIKTEIEKGRAVPDIADELKKKLTAYFKPELLNRFSDVIVFRNLTVEETYAVAGFLLKEVKALLRESNHIELKVEEEALRKIAEMGYSPVFGARPLRQVISTEVKGVLAEKILRNEVPRGSTVAVSLEGGKFRFSVTQIT